MQPSKAFWNTEYDDLNGRHSAIRNELTSYRAYWQFCLGNEGLAIELLSRTENGVMLRVFDPFHEWTPGGTFDNTFWQTHSPESIIAYIKTRLSHLLQYDNLVFSIGNNEPTTRGNTPAFIRWCVRLADLGHEAGIRFAIAEIATAKSVWHDEVIAGVWDSLIRAMDKYRGFHIFTIHEYTTGLLPACLLPDYPLNLDNPDVLKQSNWSNAKINLDSIEGNYHIGRGALVSHVRAKQIGIEPIPFVVTECAFDWMADVVSNPERAETLGHLENRYKVATHDFMRGSTGHQYYHEWIMRETGFTGDWNDYLFEQYRWLASAYPAECEGLAIFALNHDWDIPEGHDMSHPRNDKFRQRVINEPLGEATMTQPTPINPFNPTLYEADVRVTNGTWNMRPIMVASPAVEVIGELTTEARTMLVSKERATGSTYEWYKFKEGDTVGYFAHDEKLDIQYAVDTVPDTPDDEPDDTPADTSELIARMDALEVTNQALNERITALENAITKMLEPVIVDVPDVTYTVPRFALEALSSMHDGLERTHKVHKEFLSTGTPMPPVTAQSIKFPRSTADVHSIADVGFQFNPVPAMDVDSEGNITITNEADTPTVSTVSNGDDSEAEDGSSEELDIAS